MQASKKTRREVCVDSKFGEVVVPCGPIFHFAFTHDLMGFFRTPGGKLLTDVARTSVNKFSSTGPILG